MFLQEEQLLLQRKVVLASVAVVCTRNIKTFVSVLDILFQQFFVYGQFSSGLYHQIPAKNPHLLLNPLYILLALHIVKINGIVKYV